MRQRILLVDYENTQLLDMELAGEGSRAIVFVGAKQRPPKAARHPAGARRFARVEFRSALGSGKNALDFLIACELGRFGAKRRASGMRGGEPRQGL
jgi:hypothetical protein